MKRMVFAAVVLITLCVWCSGDRLAHASRSDRVTHIIIIEEARLYQLSMEETQWITTAENRANECDSQAKTLREEAKRRDGDGKLPSDKQQKIREAVEKERQADRLREAISDIKRDAGSAYWLLGWDGTRDIMVFVAPNRAKGIKQLARGIVCSVTGDIIEAGVSVDQQFQTIDCIKWERDEKQRPPDARPQERTPIWDPHITSDGQGRRQITPSLYPKRPLPLVP